MARLMKYQMEHAQRKLEAIAHQHIGEKPVKEFEIPTTEEFCSNVINGKIKIGLPLVKLGMEDYVKAEKTGRFNRHGVGYYIASRYYAKEQLAHDKAHAKEIAAWDARRHKIRAAQSRAIDKLVLGGEDAALIALDEFRNMTF
jgi:hypothetical protein